jgi:hypothetical protein
MLLVLFLLYWTNAIVIVNVSDTVCAKMQSACVEGDVETTIASASAKSSAVRLFKVLTLAPHQGRLATGKHFIVVRPNAVSRTRCAMDHWQL